MALSLAKRCGLRWAFAAVACALGYGACSVPEFSGFDDAQGGSGGADAAGVSGQAAVGGSAATSGAGSAGSPIDAGGAAGSRGGSSQDSGGSAGSEDAAGSAGAQDSGGSAGSEASAGSAGSQNAGASGGVGDSGQDAIDAPSDSPTEEICDNGKDDNGDGRIDCFDTQCATFGGCAGFCSDAKSIGCNTILTGQSTSAAGATQRIAPPAYICAAGNRAGPEVAMRFTPLQQQDVFLELYGLSADQDVMLIDVAAGAQCNATTSCTAAGAKFIGTAGPEAVGFRSVPGRDYYIVVDGPAAGHGIRIPTRRPMVAFRRSRLRRARRLWA